MLMRDNKMMISTWWMVRFSVGKQIPKKHMDRKEVKNSSQMPLVEK